MKHILLSLLITFLAVFGVTAKVHAAYSEIGTWNAMSVFAAPPVKVIDTGDIVYYVSGGSLFAYDKNEEETHCYTSVNKLSDVAVANIFYNYDKKYLVVAYDSGNIDMLYDNGELYNLSDITDSSVAPPLTINDVAFSGNRMYVATEFGLIEFNDERHEVVQSGIYSVPVKSVAVLNDNVLIWAEKQFRHIAVGERFHSLTQFNAICSFDITAEQMVPVGESKVLVRTDNKANLVLLIDFDFATHKRLSQKQVASGTPGGYMMRDSENSYYYVADGKLYKISGNYESASAMFTFPDEFDGCVVGLYKGVSELWSLTRSGIACHDFGNLSEGLKVLSNRFKPAEFSVREVAYLLPSNDGKRVWAYNIGASGYRNEYSDKVGFNIAFTNATIDFESGKTEDYTPYPVEAHMPSALNRQNVYGKYILGPVGMVEDPDEEGVFYVGSMVDGVYKMRNGVLDGIYSCDNSPIKRADSRSIVYGVNIDNGGNLWVLGYTKDSEARPLWVLPAEKRKLKPDETTAEDWITLPTETVGYCGGKDIQWLFCKKSNIVFISDHNQANYFFVYDTRGTLNDFSDDKMRLCTRIVDQDGNVFNPTYCSAFCEDADGSVWIGTDQGVIVISNPQNAMSEDMVVRRVKVPKNDGSNTAEYLLGTDLVFSISIDAGNRKWMATKQSGLFLVSPDGSEIIENFNIENSPLPSNNISSVYADVSGTTIYVGTAEGVYTYASDATPAEEDFEKITVFPNPVTPDYSGPIHVKGLMENSLVKIADASGQVLYQGRSEGGMFSWNGCNSAGERVPSGIYYVFASQSNGMETSGGTAKFMIIK